MTNEASAENKQYDAPAAEAKWRDYWVTNKTFAWNAAEGRDSSFVIDTPPPYASGTLHIGHVYSYTQTDLTARFMRMNGKNVFYPLGFDDNGLPTERLVEKEKNIRAVDMQREEFIRLCQDMVGVFESQYRANMQALGLSVDWSQEYQTISAHARRISQLSVIDLFHKGQAYRGFNPTLWDPVDQTALAQSEITERELPGVFYDFAFKVEETGEELVIASTRPELLGACVAVMVAPDHPRAGELVGKHAITPLYGVRVPIMTSASVTMDKGTGIMMRCTFGDQNDVEEWKNLKLPTRVIVDKKGRMTDMAGYGSAGWETVDAATGFATRDALAGLFVKQAKVKIAELLDAAGLLRGQREVLRMVPCAERSGAPLEIIVTPQWFIRVLDKKQALIEAGRKVRWTPDFMRVRFEQWTENLKWDWAISRQRHFGVPLPFWYSKRAGEEGKIIPAAPEQLPVDPLVDLPAGYTRDEVQAETDVMDTWATSSVSPQINAHGIAAGDERYAKLFPAHLRPQGHDIIRTWAFYTIVKSYLHTGGIPWETAAISGWCLAQDKTKMSKSKGNVVRPEDVFAQYGVDVVRYWTANGRLGTDGVFDPNILKIGKRLQTKLWNAARFVSIQILKNMHPHDVRPDKPLSDAFTPTQTLASCEKYITHPLDRWISTRLAETIKAATKHHLEYSYADALRVTEEFFWKDLCDNYLELVKARAYGESGDAAGRKSAQTTLYFVLEATIRLFAPYMPFITEELYSTLFAARWQKAGSVHARGMWPQAGDYITDAAAEAEGERIVALLSAVRKAKSLANVSIKNPATRLAVVGAKPSDAALLDFCTAASVPMPEFVDAPIADLPSVTNDEGTATIQIALMTVEKKTA